MHIESMGFLIRHFSQVLVLVFFPSPKPGFAVGGTCMYVLSSQIEEAPEKKKVERVAHLPQHAELSA